MLDALSELDGIELTREDNPFYYLRYQRNIQQANDRERQTTTFHADSVIYMPGVDEASVTDRLGVIGRAVRGDDRRQHRTREVVRNREADSIWLRPHRKESW